MKINRNNYEAYFIDYLEGILDEKLVDDFLEFLQENPDLKEELALLQSVSLEPEEIQFNKKEKLFRNKFDLEDHFNHNSVALLEGDLSSDEKADFENYLSSHPEKNKEFQLFERTKLRPDQSIKFNKKNSLYHRSAGRSIMMWGVRIAAVFILALTFYVLADRYSTNKVEEPKVAVIEKETPQIETQKKEIPKKEKQQVVSPEKEVKKPEVNPDNKTTEPALTKPVQENTKTIQENYNGRINEPDIAVERTRVEPISSMASLSASLDVFQPQATLSTMNYTIAEEPVNQDEERFMTDVIIEKTGINKLSFNKIAKAGLNIVSNISKDKFTYETNESGKVTELNYDSRLLAFSIPTNGETEK